MIRALFITTAMLLSMSAIAQTGPCSAGIQDPPIFSVVLDSPVRLSFKNSTQAMLSPPTVSIEGNDITVVQLDGDANHLPVVTCNSQSVALGDLSRGSYTVTWKYQAGLLNVFFATFSFAFTVPEAVPCAAGINVQPQSPASGQPVSFVYSIPYRFFFQTPSIAIDGDQIAIDQQAFIADPAFPGHVPCGRGVVQIGALQLGYYTALVRMASFGPLSVSFAVRPPIRGRAVRGR